MKSFKSFLNEGGNIKVGPKGQETSAAPFPIHPHTRAERRNDVHTALSKIHDAFHKQHGEHLFGADKHHFCVAHVYQVMQPLLMQSLAQLASVDLGCCKTGTRL
jgi:hypothetical protein